MIRLLKNLFVFNVYRFLLCIVYVTYLTKSIHYSIFFPFSFNLEKFFLVFFLSSCLEFYFLIERKTRKFEVYSIYALYLFFYIPCSVLFFIKNLGWRFYYLLVLYQVIIFMFEKFMRIPKIKIPKIRLIKILKNLFIVFLYFCILFILFEKNIKINIEYFNLYKVYEIRKSINLSVIENIILFWMGYTINPILAIKSYKKKKYKIFFVYFIIQIFIFFIAGHKTQLFLIPAGLFFSFITEKIKSPDKLKIFSVLFILSGLLEEIIIKKSFINEFLVRRLLFIPALLVEYYLDFFSKNNKLFLSEDLFLSRILAKVFKESRVYEIGSGIIIGKKYFFSENVSANTGLLAYGYADFGILGIIFSAIFLVIILKLINNKLEKNEEFFGIVFLLTILFIMNIPLNSFIYYIFFPLILIF